MRSASRIACVLSLIVILTLVFIACDSNSIRRPMRRPSEYRNALAQYKSAFIVPSQIDNERRMRVWQQSLPPESRITATISGQGPGHVTVHFPDAPDPLRVHPPADYTSTQDVRVKRTTLYIYRIITLLWTEHRLAVYD